MCVFAVEHTAGGGETTDTQQTRLQDVVTAALEAGLGASAPLTLLFHDPAASLAADWQRLGRFRSVFCKEGKLVDEEGKDVGVVWELSSAQDLKAAEAAAFEHESGTFIMDASDWKVGTDERAVMY